MHAPREMQDLPLIPWFTWFVNCLWLCRAKFSMKNIFRASYISKISRAVFKVCGTKKIYITLFNVWQLFYEKHQNLYHLPRNHSRFISDRLQLDKTKNKWKILYKEITKKETRKYSTSTYLTGLSNRTVKKVGRRWTPEEKKNEYIYIES